MSPEEFIKKWRAVTVSEIAASQSHFNDLCDLIDEPKPLEVDPAGERYAFEKHLFKLDGRPGRADVWKKGCFAWEYKRVHRYKSLAAAYGQLKEYSDALENPPLLIVCDISEIQIHTNFTNAVKVVHVIKLIDLNDPTKRRLLKHAFSQPHLLKPDTTREQATNVAAREVAFIARKLRDAGNDAERVAHFLNKLVFCMFAEDIGLLPNYLFSELLEQARDYPENFRGMAETLFRAMQNRNSFFGTQRIPWFNGGLFADAEALGLSNQQIQDLYKVALLDWSAIEPPIFGTLFERGLDPEKRTLLATLLGERKGGGVGIHYTDPDKIMKIVEPVVLRPLRAEWDAVKAKIQVEFAKKVAASTLSAQTRYENNARELYAGFLDRLSAYRVLDPACGSGNFLYVALLKLKDFEAEVMHEAEPMGLPRQFPHIGPEAVMGIEINPYAAELARLVVWIGELQWQLNNGGNFKREPILRPLNQIECRDALINPDGTEAEWPKVDAIIGNPPFLGAKWMQRNLGEAYADSLRECYVSRITKTSDLVMYWFEKARAAVVNTRASRAGFVATNMIRGSANRMTMNAISESTTIFEVWSDEPWAVDGADVRVSLVCFSGTKEDKVALDDQPVVGVNSNLTIAGVDLTKSARLKENHGIAVRGIEPGGAFKISGALARSWLATLSRSPDHSGARILRPVTSGRDINVRPQDEWIIDFSGLTEEEAQEFGLTPNLPAVDYAADPRAIAIAAAAKALNDAREAWLNPPELVKRVPEVVPGYPDRILPVSPEAAEILKTRTLTKLYNERPEWLEKLHKSLDAAVARAYGWPEDISDDDALARLFALNQERAAAER